MCVKLNLSAAELTLTQHCKSTALQFKKDSCNRGERLNSTPRKQRREGLTCRGEVLGEASGETAAVMGQLFLLTVYGSETPDPPQRLGDWVPVSLADDISGGMAPIAGL